MNSHRKMIYILLLLLSNCGKKEDRDLSVDQRLIVAFDKIIAGLQARGIELNLKRIDSVELVTPENWQHPEMVGVCFPSYTQRYQYTKIKANEVSARIQILERDSMNEMTATLAHEIGHCLFELGHSDDPTNIMYPTAHYSLFPSIEDSIEGLAKVLGH